MPPSPSPTIASCAHSATAAAKLFMQLAPPSRCAPKPVLEFLWPRAGIAGYAGGRAVRRSISNSSGSVGRATTRVRQVAATPPSSSSARRILSRRIGNLAPTTLSAAATPRTVITPYIPARRFTQVVFNPQKDDDGNEMKLEITPRAAKRLSDIMRKDDNPNLALRIQVESGGCHGFQYLMSLVTLPDNLPSSPPETAASSEHPGEGADSGAIREDDTIFTYSPEETSGNSEVSGAPKIILDQPSLELLKGSKVDFTMELIGSQFKIVDNPLATSSCGCGTSFDIKF